MTDRSSHGFLRRTARRAAVLAGAAAVSLAVSAAPAQADTFTATCSPSTSQTGISIQMLGVTMSPGHGMRLTLMTEPMGGTATPHAQFVAEHGQPYWLQGGLTDGSGFNSGIEVSAIPQGVAGALGGGENTAVRAWYVVEYFRIHPDRTWEPVNAPGYTHPVRAHDGGEWCRAI